jgi:hypothetical protein
MAEDFMHDRQRVEVLAVTVFLYSSFRNALR